MKVNEATFYNSIYRHFIYYAKSHQMGERNKKPSNQLQPMDELEKWKKKRKCFSDTDNNAILPIYFELNRGELKSFHFSQREANKAKVRNYRPIFPAKNKISTIASSFLLHFPQFTQWPNF